MPLVIEMEDEGAASPILCAEKTTFAYIKHQNLYVVAVTKKNANMALVFVFLHKLVKVGLWASYAALGRVGKRL